MTGPLNPRRIAQIQSILQSRETLECDPESLEAPRQTVNDIERRPDCINSARRLQVKSALLYLM